MRIVFIFTSSSSSSSSNQDGVHALMSASFHGHTEVVHVLLIAGANIDAKDTVSLC